MCETDAVGNKRRLRWRTCENDKDVRLKSESVDLRLHAQIAQLVKARVFWPGTWASVRSNPTLGRLSKSVLCDDIELSRLQDQLTQALVLIQQWRVGWVFFYLRKKCSCVFGIVFKSRLQQFCKDFC